MNQQRLFAVVDKEWTQVFQGWPVKITTALTPLVILLGMALQSQLSHLHVIADILKINVQGVNLYSNPDNWRRTGDFYVVVFVVLPLFSVVRIASAGIINDKASRSLEPLLATPLTGGELFAGKVFAAVAPALLCVWVSYVVFVAAMAYFGVAATDILGGLKGSIWLLSVFIVTPLLAVLQAILTLLICAQTGSARAAEHFSNLMLGLVSTTMLGAILYLACNYYLYQKRLLAAALLLKLAVALVFLGLFFFQLCLRRFQRETILFKWK